MHDAGIRCSAAVADRCGQFFAGWTTRGWRGHQSGQAMTEYLVIAGALLAGGIGYGLFGEGGGLLGQLIDALRGFHHRFSMTLSLPL